MAGERTSGRPNPMMGPANNSRADASDVERRVAITCRGSPRPRAGVAISRAWCGRRVLYSASPVIDRSLGGGPFADLAAPPLVARWGGAGLSRGLIHRRSWEVWRDRHCPSSQFRDVDDPARMNNPGPENRKVGVDPAPGHPWPLS